MSSPLAVEVVYKNSLDELLANLTVADGLTLLIKAGATIRAEAGATIIGFGSGGSVSWGSIIGILADQTDLATALGLKANLVSPSFITPTLGVAVATSVNGLTITTGTGTLTIPNGIVLNAGAGGTLLAMAFKANVAETDLSFTDVTTANASTTKHGLSPKLPNDAAKFLNGVGAFAVPSGTGDVVGPASAVSGNFASYSGTTGKLVADSGKSSASFATDAQGVKADSALQSSIATSTITNPTYTFDDTLQSVIASVVGDMVISADGYAQGRRMSIFFIPTSSDQTLTLPGWRWMEGAPAQIKADKAMWIDLFCTDSSEFSVFAVYGAEL